MLRFFIALWAGKLVSWIFRLRGRTEDDWPGLLANKLCSDFMARVHKPKLVICVTGTNGKSTTCELVANMLKKQGYKISYNEWGANMNAGYSYNLMHAVNIFNQPIVDAAVLESDERLLDETMGMIKPNYILVTNICKDSLRRNAHPEFIFDIMNRTFEELGDKTKAILNANDPISSQLAEHSARVYYGMTDIGSHPFENRAKDITVCPRCGELIHYHYRIYRHFGDFYCPSCDFKTPDAKYYLSACDLKGRKITVQEDGEPFDYPLISDSVYNVFNVLSFIALMREIGIPKKDLAAFLSTQKVTELRETCIEYNGIKYFTFGAKGQNSSAASTVFEYLAKDPADKELVLLMDEMQDDNHPPETVTWLYETDFEFLNRPNIKKIIVGGHMFLNYKVRLLLAGIPEDKIVCVENEDDIPQYVDRTGIDSVYVLFEVDFVEKAAKMRDTLVNKCKEEDQKHEER